MFAIKRRAGSFQFREFLVFAPTVFLLMALMQFFMQWAFMRFLLYHQQYRILPADSYICQIYTAEDYRKLADRNLETVFLSDGSQLGDRTEAWYDTVLPQIKRLDDDHYVRVTTLGTAHYLRNWLTATMPMAMLCAIGLAASVYSIRRLRSLIQAEGDPITIRSE
jgi:hypothetical protein